MKKVINCVFDITSVNEKVGFKLAKKIDFFKIREEDISEFTEKCALCGSLELLQDIARHLNPKVKKQVRNFLEYLG